MVMTATGLVPADQFERGEKIFSALRVEALALRDSFDDIAALLFEEAHWRALRLEDTHLLASTLEAHAGGSPGVRESYVEAVADARRFLAAHLIFKALATQEGDIRMMLGISADGEAPVLTTRSRGRRHEGHGGK